MSTTIPNVNDINRKWYIIDAAGKPIGVPLLKPHIFCAVKTNRFSHRMSIVEIM